MAPAWLVFSGLMAVLGPSHTPVAVSLLLSIGVFQIVATRLRSSGSLRGQVASFAITLVLCYLLMYSTGGIESSYYWMLLVPMITAAMVWSSKPTPILGSPDPTRDDKTIPANPAIAPQKT